MARAGSSGGDAAAGERAGDAGRPEPWELSLEEVLTAYEQPINEEQAWAVCFQCCRGLRGAPGGRRRIRDTADILLRRDGSVSARREPGAAGEGRRGGGGVRCGRGCDLPPHPPAAAGLDPAPPFRALSLLPWGLFPALPLPDGKALPRPRPSFASRPPFSGRWTPPRKPS